MLNVGELLELEENIKEELDDHLTAALSRMNRSGQSTTAWHGTPAPERIGT